MKEKLAAFLRDKLWDKYDNPLWKEDAFGDGDTFVGFSSTYEIDYERLSEEIDSFIKSFKGK